MVVQQAIYDFVNANTQGLRAFAKEAHHNKTQTTQHTTTQHSTTLHNTIK
jgi:hypothetical protein